MKKILLWIGGVFFIPILIAKIVSLFWNWNEFLIKVVFNTTDWDASDLISAIAVMSCLGFLIGVGIISYFCDEKKEKNEEK